MGIGTSNFPTYVFIVLCTSTVCSKDTKDDEATHCRDSFIEIMNEIQD